MAVPKEVQQLETDGYFVRVKQGDQRAASLFARLAAYRLNPSGSPSSYGRLKKGGGTNVDGYAEDAIVANADPADAFNVFDLVGGAGQAGASLQFDGPKPRRVGVDTWETPKPLTEAELAYLKGGGAVPGPVCPDPSAHQPKPYPGDAAFAMIGATLAADYAEAGQSLNAGSGTWFARTIFDYLTGLSLADSLLKHRKEWRQALGLG